VSVEPLGSVIIFIYHTFTSKDELAVEYLIPLMTTTTGLVDDTSQSRMTPKIPHYRLCDYPRPWNALCN
jgi:hypothetical protein